MLNFWLAAADFSTQYLDMKQTVTHIFTSEGFSAIRCLLSLSE